MAQSSAIAALQCELARPKGAQEENKEYLPSAAIRLLPLPAAELWGSWGCENWIRAPDRWGAYERNDFFEASLASFHTKKSTKFLSLGCLVFFAKSLWSLTLCDPMVCSPPGSSVHEILQARILEWVAMPSSRRSSPSRVQIQLFYVSCFLSVQFSRSVVSDSLRLHRL